MSSKEICWNIVNSLLGGAIAFVGALAGSGGNLNGAVISVTGITALLIALVKFTEYWKKEESEYMDENSRKYNEIFTFI